MSAASAPGREDDFSRFRLTEMEIVDSSPTTRTKCYTSHDDEFFGRKDQIRIVCILQ